VTELFGDALLESSAKRSQTRALEWTLWLAAHGILEAAMFVVPLYWIDRSSCVRRTTCSLVAAVMDALRQWEYEPTILNGQMFPVNLRLSIAFRSVGRANEVFP
jgi:hypothetical protein